MARVGELTPRAAVPALLVVLGLVLLVVVTFLVPPLLVPEVVEVGERVKLENDIRGTLLQGVGGALFLATAVFTWRQVQLTREREIHERYAKAVELLESEKMSVRSGAVYALQSVARDSRSDQAAVNQVLSAFVRMRSHEERSKPGEEAARDAEPPVDLQAALSTLGSLDLLAHGRRPIRDRLLLANTFAPRVNLRGANLHAVDLSESVLVEADLRAADLSNSILYGADLRGANLENADLRNAHLSSARMQDARLRQADLSGSLMASTELAGADLAGAKVLWKRGEVFPWTLPPHLKGAEYSEGTRWPPDHQPSGERCEDHGPSEPDHWHHD